MATPPTTTTTTKSVTIGPGECQVLPSGSVIKSIIVNGVATPTSSCGDLPTASSYKCGVFYFNIDDDANDNHPMDEESTYVHSLKVGSTTYTIDQLAASVTNTTLNTFIADTGLFSFTYINRFVIDDSGDNKRKAVYIYFKTPAEFYDTVMLGVTSHTDKTRPTTQYYLPHDEVTCGEYTEY